MGGRQAGISVIEVIIAMAILGLILTMTSNIIINTQQTNHQNSEKNRAAQIMMGLGRRIVSSDLSVLPPTGQTQRQLTSQQLLAMGFQETDQITARIEQVSNMVYGSVTMPQFKLTVCWKTTTCVTTQLVSGGS